MSEPTPVVPAVEPVTENTEKVAETVVENTEVVEENAGEIIEKSETVKTRIVSFFDGIGEKIVALYEWGVNCGSNKQPTECPCEEQKPEEPKTPAEAALEDIVEEHGAEVIEK